MSDFPLSDKDDAVTIAVTGADATIVVRDPASK